MKMVTWSGSLKMKRTEQFKKMFSDMRVDKPKEWRITTCRFAHKDKKKESNKYACRREHSW
jgi:hypothetical protein